MFLIVRYCNATATARNDVYNFRLMQKLNQRKVKPMGNIASLTPGNYLPVLWKLIATCAFYANKQSG